MCQVLLGAGDAEMNQAVPRADGHPPTCQSRLAILEALSVGTEKAEVEQERKGAREGDRGPQARGPGARRAARITMTAW